MGGINVKITMIEMLMEKIAPHLCFGCSKKGTTLCLNCKYNITSEPFLGCIICGKVTPNGICAQHDVPICKAWVVGIRQGTLKKVIDAYKFENVKGASTSFTALFNETLPLLPYNTVIVPIPTIASHVRKRGYDHMEVLARLLSRKRNVTVGHYLTHASKKSQHTLNRQERHREAMQTFSLSRYVNEDRSTPILLLDDIITTGSTVTSAAIVLANAGFKTVFVAALAYQALD